MKDNSFENAMNKIVGQHEAEIKQQARAEKRAIIFGRVRGVFIFLIFASLLVAAYNYRAQLTALIVPKHSAKHTALFEVITNANGEIVTNTLSEEAAAPATTEGKTAAAVNAAQQNATTRDAIIDSIAK
jgi:hypothetical protein